MGFAFKVQGLGFEVFAHIHPHTYMTRPGGGIPHAKYSEVPVTQLARC